MRVSSRPNSPRGRGENDAIVTCRGGAEVSCVIRDPDPKGYSVAKGLGTCIQRLSYLENGYVRAGDRWPFLTSRHRDPARVHLYDYCTSMTSFVYLTIDSRDMCNHRVSY